MTPCRRNRFHSNSNQIFDFYPAKCNFDFNSKQILDSIVHMLPQSERTAILNANVIDLQWIIERNSSVWSIGYIEETVKSSTMGQGVQTTPNNGPQFDPWSACLFGFMERNRVVQKCPMVVAQAWPLCYQRVQSLYTVIDPT
jgi:hypothetical protein